MKERLEALKGRTVTVVWSFAGSKPESHTGVVEGLVETRRGQSLMLSLEPRLTTVRECVDMGRSEDGKFTGPLFAKEVRRVLVQPPLYLPLRSILSIEETP